MCRKLGGAGGEGWDERWEVNIWVLHCFLFLISRRNLPSGRFFLKSNLGQKEKAKGRPRVGGGERHVCLYLNVALRGGPACLGLVNGLMSVAMGVGRGSWGTMGSSSSTWG